MESSVVKTSGDKLAAAAAAGFSIPVTLVLIPLETSSGVALYSWGEGASFFSPSDDPLACRDGGGGGGGCGSSVGEDMTRSITASGGGGGPRLSLGWC